MLRRTHRLLAITIATLAFGSTSARAAYVIDGSVADWGLSQTGSASDWTPSAAIKAYTVEDQTGGLGTYLNPGWGGQRYDAEAIYLDWDAANLYVLVVTGLPSDNPQNPSANSYGAGDILFDFGRDGSFDFGLVVKDYAGLTPGTLYEASSFNYGLWAAPGVLGSHGVDPVAVASGTATGVGQLAYSTTAITNLGTHASDRHYAIEVAIPLASFGALWGVTGPNKAFDAQWTMYCANDIVAVDPPSRVPEPAMPPLVVLAACAALAPALRRRRRTRF
ncbi:MAG: hypothetical protein GC151_04250 [Betaproteobacteria bacterium]|nr:hypothetical protein [Betaproteobacteria bacterium]